MPFGAGLSTVRAILQRYCACALERQIVVVQDRARKEEPDAYEGRYLGQRTTGRCASHHATS